MRFSTILLRLMEIRFGFFFGTKNHGICFQLVEDRSNYSFYFRTRGSRSCCGAELVGNSLLVPRPEVTAHHATAKRKAGGPRRPDAELSWQVTRRSCRARRSRPTMRRQSERQVVPGVPTRSRVGRKLLVHAAPGGHGPPCDGKAQGRWSTASRRGTKSAGHSLFMPRPEVAADLLTASS